MTPDAIALPPRSTRWNGIGRFLSLIRFSHTVFALPFALGALVVAANGRPSPRVLALVVLCMVFARTAAMLFNRLADWSLDQKNPRTASRHLLVQKRTAWLGLAVSAVAFIATSSVINRLTLALSPIALGFVLLYSVTKRFTVFTHFFLGLALAIAPVGAWIAQTGRIELAPVVLAFGVVLWVAGFDLIYATQDYQFDRAEGLQSLVVKLGISRALRLAQILHLFTLAALIGFGFFASMHLIYFAAMPLLAGALVYEHSIAKHSDVAAINRAFFQTNAFVSAVFLIATSLDRWL